MPVWAKGIICKQMFFLGLGDSSVGKELSMQASRPEFGYLARTQTLGMVACVGSLSAEGVETGGFLELAGQLT